MAVTSGNRPGRAGGRTSCDPGSGLARRSRGTLLPFLTAFPGLLPFEASSDCWRRPGPCRPLSLHATLATLAIGD
jgi:hypothetical protein